MTIGAMIKDINFSRNELYMESILIFACMRVIFEEKFSIEYI